MLMMDLNILIRILGNEKYSKSNKNPTTYT